MKKRKPLAVVVAAMLSVQTHASAASDDPQGQAAPSTGAPAQPVQIPGFHGLALADAPPEPGLSDDLKLLQGSWELRHGNEGNGPPTLRSVKTILGNRETLRRYNIASGEMLVERTVEFELSQSGPVRILTFHPVGDEPRSGFSYVYKVNQNEFLDVTGLLPGTEYRDYTNAASMWRWTRLTESPAEAPANPATVATDTQKSPLPAQGAPDTVVIKDATLTGVDEAGGMISVAIGKGDRSAQLVNVPLAEGVRLVASHVIPTINNHIPFEWQNLRRLKGNVVSIRVRTSEHGIVVVSISERND